MSSSKSRSSLIILGTAIAASVVTYIAYEYFNSHKKSTGRSKNQVLELPTIELSTFFDRDKNIDDYKAECAKVADALHKYGLCIVRDPRVHEEHNNKFLDMMEVYFGKSDGIRDARPEYHYQVGVTPQFIEKPRDHCSKLGSLGPDDKPLSPCPPELDPKWRFFWRVGPVPPKTKFPALNADDVIPPDMPQWKDVMDMWGNKMMDALFTLAEMAAVGFDIPNDSFTSKMKFGPHLLAPTGSDYSKFGKEGTVLAGYHYDLNFLTIHGKSRFPGLHVWTRDGKRAGVRIPDGCLLVQAGKQIEYLTGGHVLAGYHEVIVSQGTMDVIEQRKKENKSLWRVSSTCFGHVQSDQILEPLDKFRTPTTMAQFPPIAAGDQVKLELDAISLSRS